MTNRNLRAYALKLAKRGLRIFPVHSIQDGRCTCGNLQCTAPGKHPRTSHGHKDGTTNTEQISKWWAAKPFSNIGLVTGKISGFFVLDIDPRNGGEESLEELERIYGKIPKTKLVLTGGGGQHLYFSYPRVNIGCRSNLFRGIDIKGDGGYVLAPPSLHISNHRYEWEVSSFENNLAPPPQWLLKRLDSQHQHNEYNLKDKIFLGKAIPEGSRNNSIARLAGLLLGKGMTTNLTLDICLSINKTNCCPPLPAEEVSSVVKSIAKKELKKRQGGQHG